LKHQALLDKYDLKKNPLLMWKRKC
jgi:hypothetical protein